MDRKEKSVVGSIIIKVLFTICLLATVVFIFFQSSLVGEMSSSISLPLTDRFNSLLLQAGLGIQVSHTTVRKLGHIAEYMLLGFWLVLTLRVYTGRVLAYAAWPLLVGLGLAVLDEFYQQFVPGRVGSVTDVVIDFAGVTAGGCVALFFIMLATFIAQGVRKARHT